MEIYNNFTSEVVLSVASDLILEDRKGGFHWMPGNVIASKMDKSR